MDEDLRGQLRAIIYVRTMDHLTWCARWCEHRGYRITEVIHDPPGEVYLDLRARALAGDTDVVVLRSFAEVPEWRLPRKIGRAHV